MNVAVVKHYSAIDSFVMRFFRSLFWEIGGDSLAE